MNKRTIVIVGNGFEETELIAPVALLRTAGTEVKFFSIDNEVVIGAHHISILADGLLENYHYDEPDCIFIPGGPWVLNARHDERILDFVKKQYNNRLLLAAICAAPLILNDAGVLQGHSYTSHFSVKLEGSDETKPVIVDGNIITARGPGAAIEFGIAMAIKLYGQTAAFGVANAMCILLAK
jgi:4-methyl-5(b-hydroxyethyl)-thiazole monophosphate biosynthesis